MNQYATSNTTTQYGKGEILTDTTSFDEILKAHSLISLPIEYYWLVGNPLQTQGWILHVSVIVSEVFSLLERLLPYLKQKQLTFKVPLDKETCRNILNGCMGANKIGKIITIYPGEDLKCNLVANDLLQLTKGFKGPRILTDIHLGSQVYTRYGGHSPVLLSDENGITRKYIYDPNGNLTEDRNSIPFSMPFKLAWPFTQKCPPSKTTERKTLHNVYRIIGTLKTDVRGNVYEAIYLKSLFKTEKCVIKQGKKNMVSDDQGRDIRDRLLWQQQLHEKLRADIPLPNIFEVFEEDEDSYLAMEFVSGMSFYEVLKTINFNRTTLGNVSLAEQKIVLNYLLEIIRIIDRLHRKGYVHRDIVPGNFLINAQNRVILIDIELAYSIADTFPDKPFELGTPGFISPEQSIALPPTRAEDVYAIGAMIIAIFSGLTPLKFDTQDQERLSQCLEFFMPNRNILDLVCSCLASPPELRPPLPEIERTIEAHMNNLNQNNSLYSLNNNSSQRNDIINKIINKSIAGLIQSPMVILDDLWFSKPINKEKEGTPDRKEYSCFPGIQNGIAGILYVLARAKKHGFDVSAIENNYRSAWGYIDTVCLDQIPDIIPGLYGGSAGIAIALSEGIEAGLLDDVEISRSWIEKCLSLPTTNPSLSSGAAGQLVALNNCRKFLDPAFFHSRLYENLNEILHTQENDGSWVTLDPDTNQKGRSLSFSQGMPGIIWSLLKCQDILNDKAISNAAEKGLLWLTKKTNNLNLLFKSDEFKRLLNGREESGDERKGILLTFVKAYETLGLDYYRTVTEKALQKYPPKIIKNDYSQETGLAGLGEIYIEASRVFESTDLQDRAAWIADVFIHSFSLNPEGGCYWVMDESSIPTADLMLGTSGIIHYLLRYLNPNTVGYRILS